MSPVIGTSVRSVNKSKFRFPPSHFQKQELFEVFVDCGNKRIPLESSEICEPNGNSLIHKPLNYFSFRSYGLSSVCCKSHVFGLFWRMCALSS